MVQDTAKKRPNLPSTSKPCSRMGRSSNALLVIMHAHALMEGCTSKLDKFCIRSFRGTIRSIYELSTSMI